MIPGHFGVERSEPVNNTFLCYKVKVKAGAELVVNKRGGQ